MLYFLIGMPASGKSTIAKIVSEKLGLTCLDTDLMISEKEGLDIQLMFEKRGEAWFRKYEHELLLHWPHHDEAVVATGGGMPCFYGNIHLLNQMGITIYLNVPVEVLQSRILSAQKQVARPLLSKGPFPGILNELLSGRENSYRQARFCIDVADHHSADDVADLVIKTTSLR